MAVIAGKQLGTLATALHTFKLNINCNQSCSLLQIRNYAARKGTREKARKKKVKVEVKKSVFVPYSRRCKKSEIISVNRLRMDDTWMSEPIDDVWLGKYHKWKIYSFAEAVECHRETHHPTSYNLPNAYLTAKIELDMQGPKNKVVETFSRTVKVPNVFDHGERRTIIAFAKSPPIIEIADKAGATISGDVKLIKRIQAGEILMEGYTTAVAHPEILAELSVIRGLMKRKFPSPRLGTLGLDLETMIKKILHGIKYTAVPHDRQELFGVITVPIGNLTMSAEHLEENFAAIIRDVHSAKPKRDGPFITRTLLTSAPSPETFKVDFENYLVDKSSSASRDASYDSDDEEEEEANAQSNAF